MAIARKCDRCGVYFDKKVCHMTVDSLSAEFSDDYYDLCSDCKADFEEFMKGAKPKSLLNRFTYISEAQKKKILKEYSQAAQYAILNDSRREKHNSKG